MNKRYILLSVRDRLTRIYIDARQDIYVSSAEMLSIIHSIDDVNKLLQNT